MATTKLQASIVLEIKLFQREVGKVGQIKTIYDVEIKPHSSGNE